MRRPEGRFFIAEVSGAVMQRCRQAFSFAAALALWAGAANAGSPEPDHSAEPPSRDAGRTTWIPVEARNHLTGANSPAAVLFGVAQERGRHRPASLRVDCFDGVTTVHMDTDGLRVGPWAVAVKISIDRGRFVAASWQASAAGSSLELSGDRAVAFMGDLYGKGELRLAIVRPLSVPFLFTFTVSGAEPALGPLADRCQWSNGTAISDAGP
jgi:Type VI secretion system VasI, EvfG, VC_A0118